MCTLILGRDVLAPRTVLLAANRDEDPGRASAPPGVLSEYPPLAGGRDRVAGGTWLAVRERRAVVALLNRRDASGGPSPPVAGRRSRGLLTLDVATTAAPSGGGLAGAARATALAAIASAPYAPFSLVFASPAESWLIGVESDGAPRTQTIAPGWHVLTHMDLDDAREPRTAMLLGRLRDFRPAGIDAAIAGLADLLRGHGDNAAPAVCLHSGRMVTVSSSIVWLAEREARYLHADGRPCEHPFDDRTHLLAGAFTAVEES
jgi:hypothetical protein